MTDKQNPEETSMVTDVDDRAHRRDEDAGGGDRRTFIRRLVTGSLAASGIGAALLPAGDAAAASLLAPSRLTALTTTATPSASPVLKLTFNRKRPPTLYDLIDVVAEATGRLGCTGCGFDGIDLRLVLDEILDPEPQPNLPWTGEIQGQFSF
jgi:hypothetical protein